MEIAWASRWATELSQMRRILVPVALNQALTLSLWHWVYDCQTNPDALGLLLDARRNHSTGHDLLDGAINGLGCVALLAVMSFVMLAIALYNCQRLIRAWLGLSLGLIVFGISAAIFRDTGVATGAPDWLWPVLTLVYGVGALAVFFTDKLPLACHQGYIVTNCALVSVYYLRLLPAHTTWFLLAAIVLWDAFAVLTSYGPLHRVTQLADQYSDSILRFLMFHAELQPAAPVPTPVGLDSDCGTADEFEEDVCNPSPSATFDPDGESLCDSETPTQFKEEEEKADDEILPDLSRSRTAKDALDEDNAIRLGLGDFVFYSVLVGKAAVSRSLAATLAAAIGVQGGLVVTLTLFSDSEQTVPALPCSIALGMAFHFGTLFVLEPACLCFNDFFVSTFLA